MRITRHTSEKNHTPYRGDSGRRPQVGVEAAGENGRLRTGVPAPTCFPEAFAHLGYMLGAKAGFREGRG